jgi:hypothetical protein
MIALIGDQFGLGDEMCGVVMSTKFKEDTLSFWHRTAENKVTSTLTSKCSGHTLSHVTDWTTNRKSQRGSVIQLSECLV